MTKRATSGWLGFTVDDCQKTHETLLAQGVEFTQEPTRRVVDGLSISKNQRFVLPIEDAKTDETRQRCIEKAVSAPREGRT